LSTVFFKKCKRKTDKNACQNLPIPNDVIEAIKRFI